MTEQISLQELPFTPSLLKNLLGQDDKLRPFVSAFLSEESLVKAAKSRRFDPEIRKDLVDTITQQYSMPNEAEQHLLDRLSNPGTVTVTTGHQLNIFSGPAFFIYKLAHAVVAAKELAKKDGAPDVVPIYWMASEDHDFEEIASVRSFRQKFDWDRDSKGAVGHLSTEGLSDIADAWCAHMGWSSTSAMAQLFKSYAKAENLAAATRLLVRELFKETPILVLDADDARLKSRFLSVMKEEVLSGVAERAVTESSIKLKELGYGLQVSPRDINLFYLDDGQRWRVTRSDHRIETADPHKSWTSEEMLEEMESHPEKFSPNVILRPVYQEVILPNIAYIGGPGETSYWLQLKSLFDALDISFPILLPRNGAIVLSAKAKKLWNKIGLKVDDLNKDPERIKHSWSLRHFKSPEELESLKKEYEVLAARLEEYMSETDHGLAKQAKAVHARQVNDLAKAEKSVLRQWKRQERVNFSRIEKVHAEIFPGGTFQERSINYFALEQWLGDHLLSKLIESFPPFTPSLLILSEQNQED